MKKVYEDMCDEDRFASDRVLRRRALQSYLLYDARGTAAIFGLPGKSTGEGSISSINTACAHRIGRGQVWIPCDCHGFVDPNLPRFRDLYSGSKYPRKAKGKAVKGYQDPGASFCSLGLQSASWFLRAAEI